LLRTNKKEKLEVVYNIARQANIESIIKKVVTANNLDLAKR